MNELHPRWIHSVEDSRIDFFRHLRGNDPRITSRNGVLVEGEKQVERLLTLRLPLLSLFMEEQYYERFASLLPAAALDSCDCYVSSREVMSSIIGYPLHRGVMALAQRPKHALLGELKAPIVALNRLSDPENIGSIVRACAAFGVKSLLVDSDTCDPLIRRAVRVSMGCILTMDLCVVPNLTRALEFLNRDLQTFAVETSPNAESLHAFSLPSDCVLVFGNERDGIQEDVLRVCQRQVVIPMENDFIESLNVAATAAIVLEKLYQAKTTRPDKRF